MKHRGTVILLALLAAGAGAMSVGLVRAADEELDLGGPVVVSPSSSPGGANASRAVRGDEGASEPVRTDDGASGPVRTDEAGASEPSRTGEASAAKSGEPVRSERPTPRKAKAEPVQPPSPRPGGGGGDDDDDDGGDDDGDD
ncbi:hypothetical protein FXF51_46255 [Nonomuraea sp. PA05]|uniref:hypothetical protein n=1 Tax=Nonomuraea sp. PA05 TaxID=2604466 RepID=UPI0011DA0CF3|nr:hypothetical protein [Nonomuraea sp. PA05]TYB55073.1 hypothetical protein FXF51_46255 [Nonomuraea sp. PA05]